MLLDLATGDVGRRAARAVRGRPRACSREVVASCGVRRRGDAPRRRRVPIAGIAGDQQAALFGQGCFAPGDAKTTYGTGSFVLVNLGERAGAPRRGPADDGRRGRSGARPQYALEGSVLVGGAAVQWLRDGLGADRVGGGERGARGASSRPAASTSSPRSPDSARRTGARTRAASSAGITRGTTRAHLVRAALEAIAHPGRGRARRAAASTSACCARTAERPPTGSSCSSRPTCSACPVEVAADAEATALGAAALAGLAVGTWSSADEVASLLRRGERYEPRLGPEEVERQREEWREAVRRVLV